MDASSKSVKIVRAKDLSSVEHVARTCARQGHKGFWWGNPHWKPKIRLEVACWGWVVD